MLKEREIIELRIARLEQMAEEGVTEPDEFFGIEAEILASYDRCEAGMLASPKIDFGV